MLLSVEADRQTSRWLVPRRGPYAIRPHCLFDANFAMDPHPESTERLNGHQEDEIADRNALRSLTNPSVGSSANVMTSAAVGHSVSARSATPALYTHLDAEKVLDQFGKYGKYQVRRVLDFGR